MDKDTRNSAVAALWIMLGFGIAAFYMPTMMLVVGEYSTIAAGAVAILFVAAFFLLFWWRGRSRRKDEG